MGLVCQTFFFFFAIVWAMLTFLDKVYKLLSGPREYVSLQNSSFPVGFLKNRLIISN